MAFNVFLNWVLIYGNLGAPAMGVEGAAVASVIATCIGLGFLLYAFGRRWVIPRPPGPLRLRASEFARMLRFGVPNGLNWFLEFGAFLLFINVFVAELGTATLAAMMVVFNINSVSFMPALGLASAGAILTGEAIGRGRPDDVPRFVKTTMAVAAIWQCTVGLFYLLIPSALMSLFAPDDVRSAELLEVGAVMLAISAAWQMFDAAVLTLSEALRSAGDTTWTLWARLAMAWLVFVPAAFVSVKVLGGGHVAAMLCVVGYVALLAGLFAWRFRGGAWRRIDLTGVDPIAV
jgi:MATE family multidrug resistance protein